MLKRFSESKIPMWLINIGYILALCIIIFPLLLIAKYDYPSADDWSYGIKAYKVVKEGGNFVQILFAAAQRAWEAWLGWDGRFANSFLDSLQPGIWGERYYALTPYLLIGSLITSEMLFFYFMISFVSKSRRHLLLWIPIVIPVLIIQLLFTPFPVESFYWYTGGMNYTFMYGLSLILIILFVGLGMQKISAVQGKFLLSIIAWVIAIFIGGVTFPQASLL